MKTLSSILLWGMLLASSRLVAPAAQLPDPDEVVLLPPLMVEEKARPLPWRYLALPGLELLSVCSDSTALALLRRQHRMEELLTVLLPERLGAKSAVAEVQILFNEETGRAHSQEIIAEMMKQGGTRARIDDGGPLIPDNDRTIIERTPFRRAPRISFLPNMRLADLDASAVFMILRDDASVASGITFASDRVAFMIERRTPALPDWFVEGTLGLYARTTLLDNELAIEPAKWVSTAEAAALARDPEQPRTLLPMAELFARRRPKNPDDDDETDRLWRAQCALFVRWAVAEKTGARKEALWKFVDRLEAEPPSEALFREHFGMGFADARDRLSDYLPGAVETKLTLDGPKTKPLPRLRFRPATDVEVARIRGRWERMEIAYVRKRYPDLAGKYVEQARRTLHRVDGQGGGDLQLTAELGLTEIDAGNPEGARDFLQAAVQGGVARPRADLELARLRFKAVPGIADPSTQLTAGQAGDILAPLRAGRLVQPPLLEIYALMADTLTRSAAPPTGEDLAILREGARLFPQASAYVLRASLLHAQQGRVAEAIALAEAGSLHAPDPAIRERLDRLHAELAAMKK